ncbi:hypothetical protein BvCmsNSP039_00816 [Escherichia coli]|nr:hypothetical protein BvCmsKKP057_04976 [Escherichia coli]GDQ20298.1 hypothetical protein BvCmsNSP039_00816 [Escherichia coli]
MMSRLSARTDSSSSTWIPDVNSPFSRSRGISCSRLMASSIPARARSITPFSGGSIPTVLASTSVYVNCTFRSLNPAMACVTACCTSGPSCEAGPGVCVRVSARWSTSSRYARMSNPVSFSVCIHSAILTSGSTCCLDFRVSSAATSRDFSEASSPTASRIACERPEKASTGTPGISHIPCLPTTSVS